MGQSKLKRQKHKGQRTGSVTPPAVAAEGEDAPTTSGTTKDELIRFSRCPTAPCSSTAVASFIESTQQRSEDGSGAITDDTDGSTEHKAHQRMFGRGVGSGAKRVTVDSLSGLDGAQVDARRKIAATIPKLSEFHFGCPTDPEARKHWFTMEHHDMELRVGVQLQQTLELQKRRGLNSSALRNTGTTTANSGGGSPSSTASGSRQGSTGRDRLAQKAKQKIQEDNDEPTTTTHPSAGSDADGGNGFVTDTSAKRNSVGGSPPPEHINGHSTATSEGAGGKYEKGQMRSQMIHFQLKAEQLEESMENLKKSHNLEMDAKDESYRDEYLNLTTRLTELGNSCERETKRRMTAEEEVTELKRSTLELKRELEMQRYNQEDLKRRTQETLQRIEPLQRELEKSKLAFADAQCEVDRSQARYQKAEEQVKRKEREARQHDSEVAFYKNGGIDVNDIVKEKDVELAKRDIQIRKLKSELVPIEQKVKFLEGKLEHADARLRDQVANFVANSRKAKDDVENKSKLIENLTRTVGDLQAQLDAHAKKKMAPSTENQKSPAQALQQMNALAEAQREIERLNLDNANIREELKKSAEVQKSLRDETKQLRESNVEDMQSFVAGVADHFAQSTALVLSHEEDNEAMLRRRVLEQEVLSRNALKHFEQVQLGTLELDVPSPTRTQAPVPPSAGSRSGGTKQQPTTTKKEKKSGKK